MDIWVLLPLGCGTLPVGGVKYAYIIVIHAPKTSKAKGSDKWIKWERTNLGTVKQKTHLCRTCGPHDYHDNLLSVKNRGLNVNDLWLNVTILHI